MVSQSIHKKIALGTLYSNPRAFPTTMYHQQHDNATLSPRDSPASPPCDSIITQKKVLQFTPKAPEKERSMAKDEDGVPDCMPLLPFDCFIPDCFDEETTEPSSFRLRFRPTDSLRPLPRFNDLTISDSAFRPVHDTPDENFSYYAKSSQPSIIFPKKRYLWVSERHPHVYEWQMHLSTTF